MPACVFIPPGFVTVQTVGTCETGPFTAGSDSVSNMEPGRKPCIHLKTRYITHYIDSVSS